MKILEAIKRAWADPCKDPRCKECVHIGGPICHYPNECSSMRDPNTTFDEWINYKNIGFQIYPFKSIIELQVNDYLWNSEHKIDIDYLLKNGYWLTVFPFNNEIEEGFAYEYYWQHKDKSWSEMGSNAIFSSSHLISVYKTKEEAWTAGVNQIKSYINNK